MKREDMARYVEAALGGEAVTSVQVGDAWFVLGWVDQRCRAFELRVEAGLDGMLSYRLTREPPKEGGGE